MREHRPEASLEGRTSVMQALADHVVSSLDNLTEHAQAAE